MSQSRWQQEMQLSCGRENVKGGKLVVERAHGELSDGLDEKPGGRQQLGITALTRTSHVTVGCTVVVHACNYR